MTVSLAQEGEGLGTVWGEELVVDMLKEAGFRNVRIEVLDDDVLKINNFYIVTN